MGHERVSIYQSLCLREVLHRNSKHELMVEPVRAHTYTEKSHYITSTDEKEKEEKV